MPEETYTARERLRCERLASLLDLETSIREDALGALVVGSWDEAARLLEAAELAARLAEKLARHYGTETAGAPPSPPSWKSTGLHLYATVDREKKEAADA